MATATEQTDTEWTMGIGSILMSHLDCNNILATVVSKINTAIGCSIVRGVRNAAAKNAWRQRAVVVVVISFVRAVVSSVKIVQRHTVRTVSKPATVATRSCVALIIISAKRKTAGRETVQPV